VEIRFKQQILRLTPGIFGWEGGRDGHCCSGSSPADGHRGVGLRVREIDRQQN